MQHHMHDLVCGMTVEPEHGAGTEVYHGTTYTCCSPHCLEKFRADPAQYVTPGHVHETHRCLPSGGPPRGEPLLSSAWAAGVGAYGVLQRQVCPSGAVLAFVWSRGCTPALSRVSTEQRA